MPGVGEDDRVLLAQHVDRPPVVLVVERGRDGGVHVVGDDLQTGGGLRGEPPDVHVAVEVRDRLDQVTDGRAGLPAHAAAERAGVRVGVDREDLVLPLGGEGGAQRGGGRGLADAALEADHRDPVAGQHRGADQVQLPLPLGLFLLSAQLEPAAAGRRTAALRLLLLAVEQPVRGQLHGSGVTERRGTAMGRLPLVVLDRLRPGGTRAGVDGRLALRLLPLRVGLGLGLGLGLKRLTRLPRLAGRRRVRLRLTLLLGRLREAVSALLRGGLREAVPRLLWAGLRLRGGLREAVPALGVLRRGRRLREAVAALRGSRRSGRGCRGRRGVVAAGLREAVARRRRRGGLWCRGSVPAGRRRLRGLRLERLLLGRLREAVPARLGRGRVRLRGGRSPRLGMRGPLRRGGRCRGLVGRRQRRDTALGRRRGSPGGPGVRRGSGESCGPRGTLRGVVGADGRLGALGAVVVRGALLRGVVRCGGVRSPGGRAGRIGRASRVRRTE